MSFSSVAKDELIRQRLRGDDAASAAHTALTMTSGGLTLGRGGMAVHYTTESESVARYVEKLSRRLYDVEASALMSEKRGRGARSVIVTLRGSGCADIIEACGLMSVGEGDGERIARFTRSERCRIAFVRGAFLGAGSVSDPQKSYHLEIVCRNEALGRELISILSEHGVRAKLRERKETHVVYVKEADMISGVLALIGAHDAALRFEEVRAIKSINNDINRIGNCDVANMQKTAEAAALQAKGIELISRRMGLERLPNGLRQVAEARLNNREASLNDLAVELGIGRSAVNYRLSKLMRLADELRSKYGEE
ncbi:MAG: DNA-binding protein WhiA [Clostridia bacterium]|nr:DNA-binding protein WhiA [Clostridia bacterium]